MSNMIEKSFNNLVSGKVFSDFNDLPYEGQKRVVIKTAIIAVTAGIIAGLVFGAIPAVIVTGVVGIGAFAYSVTRYAPTDFISDAIRGISKKVTNKNDLIDDIIDGSAELYRKAETKVVNLFKKTPKKQVRIDRHTHTIHRNNVNVR